MKNLFLSAVILFTASLYAQQPKPMRYALQLIDAYQLDFENPPYFSRLFKKEAGLTPITYKQQFLN